MRIAAVSDLHGFLSHTIPQCDVMVVAGDFVPLYSSAEEWKSRQELDWVRRKFAKWLHRNIEDSGCAVCYVMPGNHDMLLWDVDTYEEAVMALRAAHHRVEVHAPKSMGVSTAHYMGINLAFYPWTPTINQRNWAYSQPRSSRAVALCTGHIPLDTDVLVSHGPPLGLLDEVREGQEVHQGCATLMHRLIEVGPKLTICGHIHEMRGKRQRYWDLSGTERKIGNVSLCDREYSVAGAKVQVFDI